MPAAERRSAAMGGAEHDAWTAGESYEAYMGRWSRQVAAAFLGWLDPPRGGDWVEVGCGTGALTAAALPRAPRRCSRSILRRTSWRRPGGAARPAGARSSAARRGRCRWRTQPSTSRSRGWC